MSPRADAANLVMPSVPTYMRGVIDFGTDFGVGVKFEPFVGFAELSER